MVLPRNSYRMPAREVLVSGCCVMVRRRRVTHWCRRQRQRGIITAVPMRPPLADERAKCVIPVKELLEFHQPRRGCARPSVCCGVSTTEAGGALVPKGEPARNVSAKRHFDDKRRGDRCAAAGSDVVFVVVVVGEKRVGVEGKVLRTR